jgi:aryl-alcohol dehydrogenase-like predicted oxidoreductase
MGTKRDAGGLDRREFLKTATAGAVGLGLTGMTARSLMADEGKPKDRVATRPLGKTGLNVSVIGFGCGGLAPQHVPLLRAAHENGITLFDTAWGYGRGRSEDALGKFVETLKDRESIRIVTKATGWAPRGSAKEVYASLKDRLTGSLRRLKSAYVDLFYWPHGASSPDATRHKACREALLRLKEEDLIRHVGTSSHSNYAETCKAAVEDGFYEALMPVINICTQNPDRVGDVQSGGGRRRRRGRSIEDTRAMLKAAVRKKVGIIGMKVANGGYLGAGHEDLLAQAFPGETGLSRHQKLYTWMLRQEGISAVLVGIRNATHLKEAIAVGKRVT